MPLNDSIAALCALDASLPSEAIWTEILTESKMLGGIELRRRALRSQGFDV